MIEKTSNDLEQTAIRDETMLVVLSSLIAALLSLAYCLRHGLLLLYGDAVSHLYIARRIVDSLNPGYRQLGSVWLPLPHLLLLPFVLRASWWHSGLAGAFVSIPCYMLGCAGLYRLSRIWLPVSAGIAAAAFYGLNPGVLYMATTAMTEPLFLAETIWATVLIVRYWRALEVPSATAGAPERERHASRLLLAAGLVLVSAIFTRYDGWIDAAVLWGFATWPLAAKRLWKRPVAGTWLLFTAMLISAPMAWLAYNAKQFGDPLDFMRGPYSARAIEIRTTPPGAPHHPGFHNLAVSALYYLKAAELGAAPRHLGDALLILAVAGTLAALFLFRNRGIWPVLLFWLPLPFYAYAVGYGSVPIFIPIWQPFSWYNTRYGMELLPAFAFFAGCLVAALLLWRPQWKLWIVLVSGLLIVGNSVTLFLAKPLVLAEAEVNSRTRLPFESALANALLLIADRGLILMDASRDVGAVQQAGIPLRRIVSEGDYLRWQRALGDPAEAAPTVVATEGDAVSQAIKKHPEGLQLIEVICTTGQPCARIYRSQRYAGTPRNSERSPG